MNVHANLNKIVKNNRRYKRKRLASNKNCALPKFTDFCGIILDLDMPIMGGMEACERIVKAYKEFETLNFGTTIPLISYDKDAVRIQNRLRENQLQLARVESEDLLRPPILSERE